ncbi:hypothetical protein [Streptomyces sp. NPDC001970]
MESYDRETYDGETTSGTATVKLGPITLTYRGTAVFGGQDEEAHRMVLTAGGKEARGQGTARSTVTAALAPARRRDGRVGPHRSPGHRADGPVRPWGDGRGGRQARRAGRGLSPAAALRLPGATGVPGP